MKIPILLLIFITAIQFQLNFIGTEHEPNWVKVWAGNKEIPVISETKKVGDMWYWNVYTADGKVLITFLNFFQSYE